MQPGERVPILIKICLPLLILLAFSVSPVSQAVRKDLWAAELARAGEQPGDASRAEDIAQAYRRVLEREPWRAALWEQVALAELESGRVPEAIDALRRAEAGGALSADGRFQLGEALLRIGDSSAAMQAWETQLRLEGPSARVYERLFQAHRAQGDFVSAIAVLRDWRAFAPQDAQAAFLLGLHLTVFERDAAAPLLIEASKQDTSYTAEVQVLRKGLSEADVATDEAYRWLMIGRALESISEWDLAEVALRRAVEIAPNYGEAWALLGEARYHLNGGGVAEMEKANRLAPDSLVVRTVLALYWRREGKPEVALRYLEELARGNPTEPKWQVDIGNALAEANDFEGAREAYQKAIQLAPTNSLYWQYLARFCAEYKDNIREVGLPAARQAILLSPNDAGALDTMGFTFLSLGDGVSAERFLQQALEKDATYAPASLHLGWLYLQQRDAQRAYPYLKQAAALAGDNQVGMTARRLLKQFYGEGS